MKYLIHTIPKRLWYVEEYLIPSMVKQSIMKKDIYIYNDENGFGNLFAFLDSLNYVIENLSEECGVWHLQDDVIISKNFKNETEALTNTGCVVNGFVNRNYASVEKYGLVKVQDYWYSFPCVFIPNKYLEEFINWIEKVKEHAPYRKRYLKGRYDDYFFYKFLEEEHPTDNMYNRKPNLVDHIDYLLGGTTGTRKNIPVRAEYFEDLDLVEELERKLKDEYKKALQENKKIREEKP